MNKLVSSLFKNTCKLQRYQSLLGLQENVAINRLISQKFSSTHHNNKTQSGQTDNQEKSKNVERKEKVQSIFNRADKEEIDEYEYNSLDEVMEQEQSYQFQASEGEEEEYEIREEGEQENNTQRRESNFKSQSNQQKGQDGENNLDIDPSTLNEFDLQFYNFFNNNKLHKFDTLSKEKLNEIGEEYNNLIDSLLEKNLDQLYEYINETQLLAFRLYSEWIRIMVQKEYLSIEDPILKRNMTFFTEHLLTFLSPTPSKHPKQYFSCMYNYSLKVFNPVQQEMVIPIIKKNLQNISIIDLAKFANLHQNNKDFFKQLISEIMRKLPKATVLDFLFIQALFKIPEIQQNFVFTDQYLNHYSKLWQNLNTYQIIGLSRVLVLFRENDFNKYFYLFDEVVRRNMKIFKLPQVKILLKFYSSLQISAKAVYKNPITFELVQRKISLIIKSAMYSIEKLQPQGEKPIIPKAFLQKIKEYYQISKEIQYFRYGTGIAKYQSDNIVMEILQKNPQFEQIKSDIINQKIHNFVVYSKLLKKLQISERSILLSMSSQYEQSYGSVDQSLDQELIIFNNFVSLQLYYPFIEELQQKFLENIESYDFSTPGKCEKAFQMITKSSLYVPNLELIDALEKKFLEKFVNEIEEPTAALNAIIGLPPNTFREFTNTILQNSSYKFVKGQFYKIIVCLTKQGKVDPKIFMSNLNNVNLFKKSQETMFTYSKILVRNQKHSFMDQEFLQTLLHVSERYFADKKLKIIGQTHLVEGHLIKFLIQDSEKSLHLNVMHRELVYINKLDTLNHNEQIKALYLKEIINYEYITFTDFNTKDRTQVVKDLLTKYFRN